jgi:hypothetical protein
MASPRIVSVAEETPDEKALREWFAAQALGSLDTLEAAARTILQLVTGLLGVLFAVLSLAADPPPAYLDLSAVRWLGSVSIAGLLVAQAAALAVVLPSPVNVSTHRLDEQEAAFRALAERKSLRLRVAVAGFGLGLVALGIVLIIALHEVT